MPLVSPEILYECSYMQHMCEPLGVLLSRSKGSTGYVFSGRVCFLGGKLLDFISVRV